MSQMIYRTHGTNDPFARIPHALLEDDRISWQAKGILCYLVGKPPDWKMRVTDLVKRGTAKKHAIRAALYELRAIGYVELECIRGEGGTVKEWAWRICDYPKFQPEPSFPDLEKQDLENQHLSKKEVSKKDCSKNQSKEPKETAEAIASPAFVSSTWKPSAIPKEEQLKRLRVPRYPSQDAFDQYVDTQDLGGILNYRPDLYRDLCRCKWHKWSERANRWVPIHDWRKYIAALDDRMLGGGI